jgi:nucleotide-binding universal stress UspA family protein
VVQVGHARSAIGAAQVLTERRQPLDIPIGWEASVYKHFLVPTDGSDLSAKAITHGVSLASALGATLTVVTVTAPLHVLAESPLLSSAPEEFAAYAANRISEEARRSLAAARMAAKLGNVPCDTLQVEHEQPHLGIIETAKSRGCDLIVMASHGRRGVSAILLGSETLKVLTHSTIPVLIYR